MCALLHIYVPGLLPEIITSKYLVKYMFSVEYFLDSDTVVSSVWLGMIRYVYTTWYSLLLIIHQYNSRFDFLCSLYYAPEWYDFTQQSPARILFHIPKYGVFWVRGENRVNNAYESRD